MTLSLTTSGEPEKPIFGKPWDLVPTGTTIGHFQRLTTLEICNKSNESAKDQRKMFRIVENFQIFKKIQISGKFSDFRENFRFSKNLQIFEKFVRFSEIFRLSEKILDQKKHQIFENIFKFSEKFPDFWKIFRYSENLQIFWKIFRYSENALIFENVQIF